MHAVDDNKQNIENKCLNPFLKNRRSYRKPKIYSYGSEYLNS